MSNSRNAAKRGLRSPLAVRRRGEHRTFNRRIARRIKRHTSKQHKDANTQTENRGMEDASQIGATAPYHHHTPNHEQPRPNPTSSDQRSRAERIKYGALTRLATHNICTALAAGKREMIEIWMKEKDVMLLGIQETRIKTNTKESRKEFTWFFSGESRTQDHCHGVGLVVHNSFL